MPSVLPGEFEPWFYAGGHESGLWTEMQQQATLTRPDSRRPIANKLEVLRDLLGGDLEFHSQQSNYSTHDLHAFAAKFPPQLPALFIRNLTEPGETVLDPMMGSGTAVVETALSGRRALGLDIDPLALRLCRVKTQPIPDGMLLHRLAENIVASASDLVGGTQVETELAARFDPKTKAFVDYWFYPQTQRELMALLLSMELVTQTLADASLRQQVREFFEVAFSSIIITKSGGVSRARDLAHTRPHLAGDKVPKNAIDQFRVRARNNIESLKSLSQLPSGAATLKAGDARNLCGVVGDASVRLVVTSPPYANAIDYMRAHKFSLVWLGYRIDQLSALRSTYVGSERAPDYHFSTPFAEHVEATIAAVAQRDRQKAKVLRKYLGDMRQVLAEVYRVLMPNSAAVMVVGSSTMRGIVVETAQCLASIAESLSPPFTVAGIGHRRLDRDRRMMPAWNQVGDHSQIEQRMHEEDVLALYKPPA